MWIILAVLALAVAGTLAFLQWGPQAGARAHGGRLARMQAASNYADGHFANPVPTSMDIPASSYPKLFKEMLWPATDRRPQRPLRTARFDRSAWEALPNEGLFLSWHGHSTLLLKVDGTTLLTDPVLSERASMFRWAGPERFRAEHYLTVDDLPNVDVILLSHDHYDHLDHRTMRALHERVPRFIAPLGVGAHLERWGVPAARITECGWWEHATVGGLTLTAAPTRHFSGRGLSTRNTTLWCGWALENAAHKVFFGGDTGYFEGMREIGGRLGPFDLVMLDCGAYDRRWSQIHMLPEEGVQAAIDLRARRLMPIHWGKFDLAAHPWTEPIERISRRAAEQGLPLFTPRPGTIVSPGDPSVRWWVE